MIRWTNQIRRDASWAWIMTIVSQDLALNINMWNKVFGENVSPACTLCSKIEESLAQLESEYL